MLVQDQAQMGGGLPADVKAGGGEGQTYFIHANAAFKLCQTLL